MKEVVRPCVEQKERKREKKEIPVNCVVVHSSSLLGSNKTWIEALNTLVNFQHFTWWSRWMNKGNFGEVMWCVCVLQLLVFPKGGNKREWRWWWCWWWWWGKCMNKWMETIWKFLHKLSRIYSLQHTHTHTQYNEKLCTTVCCFVRWILNTLLVH